MSDLIITPVTITSIEPHPNADRLEICRVSGWDIVSGKGNYKVGDIVVHIPPDAMVPKTWADTWAVTPYLSFKKSAEFDSSTPGGRGRVRAAKLRGVTSFGFLVPNDSGASLGTDLAEHYGIEKYEPPPPPIGMSAGQMATQHPLFHTYTDIQNLRNFPDKLNYNEPVVVTEKIHGTNSRVGWVRRIDKEHQAKCPKIQAWDMPEVPCECDELEKVVGTHKTQRNPEDAGVYSLPFQLYGEKLEKLLNWAIEAIESGTFGTPLNSLLVFGEIYGAGVQDLHYGAKNEKGYRIFDISINGEYMNARALAAVCQMFDLPMVPVLFQGIATYEDLLEMAQGETTLDDTHIREGIVVRPMCLEKTWGKGDLDPNPKRVIFKLISDGYLLRKGGSEYH